MRGEVFASKSARPRVWVLALCGVVLMLLAIGLTWRVWYEWYLLYSLRQAIQVDPGIGWSASMDELERASDEINRAGLKERSIRVVLPFLKSHNRKHNLRAMIYIQGEFEHPPPVVAQALLEVANDPTFAAHERADAAGCLLFLKPDEPTRQLAQEAADRAAAELKTKKSPAAATAGDFLGKSAE
jgi:hypothetical protein